MRAVSLTWVISPRVANIRFITRHTRELLRYEFVSVAEERVPRESRSRQSSTLLLLCRHIPHWFHRRFLIMRHTRATF